MERSQLIKEHDCYKRNVIRFSVLTGIIIALLFTILTFFIISLITEEGLYFFWNGNLKFVKYKMLLFDPFF